VSSVDRLGARRLWTRSDGEQAFRHDDARPADPDLENEDDDDPEAESQP
jgi:hypothetical protein